MVCSNCKKEIDGNAKFCPFCGTPVEAQEEINEVLQSGAVQEVTEPVQNEAESEQNETESVQEEKDAWDEGTEQMDLAVPEIGEPRERSSWSPAVILITAAVVASIIVGATYFSVIRARTYAPISFTSVAQEGPAVIEVGETEN